MKLFVLVIFLSGCAWLNAPLTPSELAAHAFADKLGCNRLRSQCLPTKKPGEFFCISWGEGKTDKFRQWWCEDDESGTVTFR